MATDDNKKHILMSAVSSATSEPPTLKLPMSKHKTQQLSEKALDPTSNFKGMLDAGRKADPVVGTILVKQETVKSSFVLNQSEHDDFKVICAIKKIKMGTLIREAIVGFIAENQDLLKR